MAENSDGCGCSGLIVLSLLAFGIYSCAHKSPEKQAKAEQTAISGEASPPSTLDGARAGLNPDREFDEDRALEAADEYLSGSTYMSVRGNAGCTDDCSGHEAGWKWAQDGNDCGSGDTSFEEGCQAYTDAADERVQAAHDSFNEGDATFEKE